MLSKLGLRPIPTSPRASYLCCNSFVNARKIRAIPSVEFLDSIPCAELNAGKRKIHVYFLSPIDLVVSKLSRYETVDQEDIRAMAEQGLVSADAVQKRAEEALGGYVGEMTRI